MLPEQTEAIVHNMQGMIGAAHSAQETRRRRRANADHKERAEAALGQAEYTSRRMQDAADEPSAIQSAVKAIAADLQRLHGEGEEMRAAWDRDCGSARVAATRLEYLLEWACRTGAHRSAAWLHREEAIFWTAGIGWTDCRRDAGMSDLVEHVIGEGAEAAERVIRCMYRFGRGRGLLNLRIWGHDGYLGGTNLGRLLAFIIVTNEAPARQRPPRATAQARPHLPPTTGPTRANGAGAGQSRERAEQRGAQGREDGGMGSANEAPNEGGRGNKGTGGEKTDVPTTAIAAPLATTPTSLPSLPATTPTSTATPRTLTATSRAPTANIRALTAATCIRTATPRTLTTDATNTTRGPAI